jgi:hypothetical protein
VNIKLAAEAHLVYLARQQEQEKYEKERLILKRRSQAVVKLESVFERASLYDPAEAFGKLKSVTRQIWQESTELEPSLMFEKVDEVESTVRTKVDLRVLGLSARHLRRRNKGSFQMKMPSVPSPPTR